jgi:nanoRNase/pAp phosphatase (c-di-AMP/oligoRNAs hydrolase)
MTSSDRHSLFSQAIHNNDDPGAYGSAVVLAAVHDNCEQGVSRRQLSKGKKFSFRQKLTGIHLTSSNNGVHSLAEPIKPQAMVATDNGNKNTSRRSQSLAAMSSSTAISFEKVRGICSFGRSRDDENCFSLTFALLAEQLFHL